MLEEIVIPALITLGAIMVLGFIGNFIFNRTQIPSIVWLLLFGLIVGFVFKDYLDDPALLMTISKLIGAIAIVIILFDGGINTDLKQLFRGAPRGLLLTVSGFILSVLATTLIIVGISALGVLDTNITLENSIFIGIVLGAIVGGTSSPIVIPLASRLKNLEDKTKTVLNIESIITDPLCIVVVLAAVSMLQPSAGGIDISVGARNLVSTFSVGAVMGLVLGLIWLPVMHKVRKEEFSYVLTLAVIFLVYSAVELLLVGSGGGAGAIACLVFGLVLGNGKKVLKMFDYEGKGVEMDQKTKQFHSLTSFIIRTFFFVYLGMMVSFQKIEFIIIGVIILVALLIVRYLAVLISTHRGGFEKDDKQTMAVMMPRGLAAAILAINFGPDIVRDLGLNIDGFFKDTAFVIILGTAVTCTVGVSIISYYEKKKLHDTKEQKNNYDNIDETLNKKQ
jgi:cell volume regulation protein A